MLIFQAKVRFRLALYRSAYLALPASGDIVGFSVALYRISNSLNLYIKYRIKKKITITDIYFVSNEVKNISGLSRIRSSNNLCKK